MTAEQDDIYHRYKTKAWMAKNHGYSSEDIIKEFLNEKESILSKARQRAIILSTDRNIYKKREVMRAANECIEAIDRVIKEMESKEILA